MKVIFLSFDQTRLIWINRVVYSRNIVYAFAKKKKKIPEQSSKASSAKSVKLISENIKKKISFERKQIRKEKHPSLILCSDFNLLASIHSFKPVISTGRIRKSRAAPVTKRHIGVTRFLIVPLNYGRSIGHLITAVPRSRHNYCRKIFDGGPPSRWRNSIWSSDGHRTDAVVSIEWRVPALSSPPFPFRDLVTVNLPACTELGKPIESNYSCPPSCPASFQRRIQMKLARSAPPRIDKSLPR